MAIQKRNKLGKKSHYIKQGESEEDILNCQFEAILGAAKEIFEEIDYQELEKLVDFEQLIAVSNKLLALTYTKDPREIIHAIELKFEVKY